MCKYEMGQTIVEGADRADMILSTDGRTNGWTDKVQLVYSPFNFVEVGVGYRISLLACL